ncbi:amidase [Nocardioides daeguensis]|uniref:Amidase n=1 Tax=Nocardioides daeguensis TaxID=908359 RepID=A0ABP6VHC0_9ACTN|nr:amidase [Nocardioides daeguensis]MBV6728992.1 amidase [Nocardioides daeguensis]MCR1773513.1 amidase [Nocardioides daeguensis]
MNDRADAPPDTARDDDDLLFAGVAGQADAVREGRLSSRELVGAVLARIQRHDGRLNAFTVVAAERALAEAAARDAQRDGRGPLHGVPIAVKEEIDVAGEVTTFGGRANRTPRASDGEVVRRLRAAGAVIVGKTNMPEFGQWPFTESVAHGITCNPWDTARSPGGSSGGTAAAVAAGLVPAAIGGDGGGSIRIPAAFCGLYGLKPQRGRVTSAPAEHLWWALGTVGPLTRTVLDSALVYDAIRGAGSGDRFRADDPRRSFVDAARAEPRPLRIGVITRSGIRGVRPDREHVRAVHATADLLDALGHHVESLEPRFPDTTTAFVPQFLGGVRAELAHVERPDLVERRTRQALRLGLWATPRVVAGAMRRGETIAARVEPTFDRYDVLLTPVTPHRPPQVGVLDGVGLVGAARRSLPVTAYTALWNVTGNPAASVPAGFAADGLPLAVQLVGRRGDEPTLLTLSAELERARPWAGARPAL